MERKALREQEFNVPELPLESMIKRMLKENDYLGRGDLHSDKIEKMHKERHLLAKYKYDVPKIPLGFRKNSDDVDFTIRKSFQAK